MQLSSKSYPKNPARDSSCDFISPPDVIGTTTAFFDGEIDLDPASSDIANNFVGANKYFKFEDFGLKQSWRAKNLYLFPPRDMLPGSACPEERKLFVKKKRFKKSAQRVWLEEAVERYKRNDFEEAIIFLTSAEVALLVTQKLDIDFPLCILKDHPDLREDNRSLKPVNATKNYGFVYYLPSSINTYERISTFKDLFSNIGRCYV